MKEYVSKVIGSHVGPLKLVASGEGLVAILWKDDNPRRVRLGNVVEDETNSILLETERQLGEYFAGQRKVFAVKLAFAGTEFQRRVWTALLTIPYGETRSYGEIAKQIGSPAAVRAVGAANGRNPISIIAPCHRVVGSTGKLTGFAGGLEVKAQLLALEAGEGGSLPGWESPHNPTRKRQGRGGDPSASSIVGALNSRSAMRSNSVWSVARTCASTTLR